MRTVMKRVLVTGGAGFLGSHLCERLRAQGHDVLCVDNYFTGRKDNIAGLLGDPHFEAMRHDVTHPLFVEVDEIYNLACPASPIHYQFDPGADDQDQRDRRDQHAGAGEASQGQDPADLDLRGLRRPGRASAARIVSRQRQPDRAARLLRRGQALRRDAVLRLLPPAQSAHSRGPHLQYLRAAHAPE